MSGKIYKYISISVLLIFVLFLVAVIASGFIIYRSKDDKTLASRLSKVIPYPAAYAAGDIVRYSDWSKKVTFLKTLADKSHQSFNQTEEDKKVLEEEIDAIILAKEAKRLHINITNSAVDEVFNNELKNQATDTEIERTLNDMYGMTLDQYKVELKKSVIRKQVEKALTDSGVLIKGKAKHILISVAPDADQKTQDEAKKKAEDIIKQLNEGKKFEDLAAQYSEDKASRDIGGDIGEFVHGDLVPEFEDAVFNASGPGLITTPVKSKYGYHVIMVTEKKGTFKASDDWLKDTKSHMRIYRFI